MNLVVQIHEHLDEEVDFCDALVNTCGGNFVADEETEDKLDAFRDDLIRLGNDYLQLSALRPEHRQSYFQQMQQAKAEIMREILKLRIPGVRRI